MPSKEKHDKIHDIGFGDNDPKRPTDKS